MNKPFRLRSPLGALLVQRALALCLSLLPAAGLAPAALAQNGDWPNRPVTIINPFPAGGGTDAYARPLAAHLDTLLGQRVIIDNRGGAGGTVGAASAAKMPPDGYSFFMGAAHHAIAPAIYPALSYDIEKDFVSVGVVALPPQVVVISPKALPEIKTLKDLIAFAKANPGKLNYASAGNGTTHHLAGELFKSLAGVDIQHVPYRGAGPALQDLVNGKVHLMFDGLGSSAPQISGGNLVGLAVASPKRAEGFPEIPTAAEQGLKGYEVSTWYALWAVKGTPEVAINRMRDALKKAFALPALKEQWTRNGSGIPDMWGSAMGTFVSAEVRRWGKVVKDSGVPPASN